MAGGAQAVELFRTSRLLGGRWRWRVLSVNGQTTGSSAQGFRDATDADRAARAFVRSLGGDPERLRFTIVS